LLAAESGRRVHSSVFRLSDQNDIWRADKLELELAAAKKIEAEHSVHAPVLVFSDLELVGQFCLPNCGRLQTFAE
jgi:hypothetical protein